jgi:putative NADH-flavin reductase
MRLTVFGATGAVGQEIVRQAMAAGHEVTAVVRDPARLPEGLGAEPHTVVPLGDPAAVRAAVAGRHAVLSGLGARGRKAGDVAERLTRRVLEAMEARGHGGCWSSARRPSARSPRTTRCSTGRSAR